MNRSSEGLRRGRSTLYASPSSQGRAILRSGMTAFPPFPSKEGDRRSPAPPERAARPRALDLIFLYSPGEGYNVAFRVRA